MVGRGVHLSTVLLATFALLSVVLALAALGGHLDPIVELLTR